jgi:hypothetical protein
VPDRKAVVRLVGEQDFDIRVMPAEGVAERPIGVPQLVLGDDVERCAEAVGKVLDVATINEQVAVRTNANKLPNLVE